MPNDTDDNKVGFKNPPVEHQFKPGESGNPDGRPHVDQLEKAVRLLTRKQVRNIGSMLLTGNMEKILALATDKEARMKAQPLEAMFACVVFKIMANGDMYMLDKLLDRICGPVEKKVSVKSGNENPGPRVIITIPSNQREPDVIDAKAEDVPSEPTSDN